MRYMRMLALLLIGALALTACADSAADIESSVSSIAEESGDEAPEVADDAANLAAEVQAEVAAVAAAVENSPASDQLREGWNELQTELAAAMTTVGEDGMIDSGAVQSELEDFQQNLDELGDDVGDEFTAAWNTLKARIEAMMG